MLADAYDRFWAPVSRRELLPALDRLVLRRLPAGARIVDLCCGAGHLTEELCARGFAVVGIDLSPAMIRIARRRAPRAVLRVGDARRFTVDDRCQAVVSVFDSLNHMPSTAELGLVFERVVAALVRGGSFVFDLNLAAAYLARRGESFGFVEDDLVCVVRTDYDRQTRRGSFAVTILRRNGAWLRTDVTLTHYCHRLDEVTDLLAESGLELVGTHDAERDLGLDGHVGRCFFVCRRR